MVELKNRAKSEINLNIMYLISIKEDLNLFYYTKNKIIGMVEIAQSLSLLSDDETVNYYNQINNI